MPVGSKKTSLQCFAQRFCYELLVAGAVRLSTILGIRGRCRKRIAWVEISLRFDFFRLVGLWRLIEHRFWCARLATRHNVVDLVRQQSFIFDQGFSHHFKLVAIFFQSFFRTLVTTINDQADFLIDALGGFFRY